jgi:hypothetical protein
LKVYPFTEKNIEIKIFNSDRFGREVKDPGISVACISDGFLVYKTIDALDSFKYKNELEETYDEAFRALHE